ncbi:MAG: trypsin-like serine protease [Planctomycetia bacterium]|nr:trypsin-like serine protease [Planctomycetia bacterium]
MAVIVAGTHATVSDASLNTSAPADDPGWSFVGATGGSTAVYLGNNWVLTAKHVVTGPTSFTFFDSGLQQTITATYQIVNNSGVILTNPVGESAQTDLYLYRIDPATSTYGAGTAYGKAPQLIRPIISVTAPSLNDTVVAIGRGADRIPSTLTGAQETKWNSSWQETANPSKYTGYQIGTVKTMRWGDNKVSQVNVVANVGTQQSPIDVHSFWTRFDPPGANPDLDTDNEFQATLGDSGGGVFHVNPLSGRWELSGTIIATTLIQNQPVFTTAAFSNPPINPNDATTQGNSTIIADLSFYLPQILAVNPIPGDFNTDGAVDISDIQTIAAQWMTSGPAGDANGDGVVDISDIQTISQYWTGPLYSDGGGSGTGAAAGAAVPEPATGMLAIAAVAAAAMAWAAAWSRKVRRGRVRD